MIIFERKKQKEMKLHIDELVSTYARGSILLQRNGYATTSEIERLSKDARALKFRQPFFLSITRRTKG